MDGISTLYLILKRNDPGEKFLCTNSYPHSNTADDTSFNFQRLRQIKGLHMGPNNLCYVTRHFLFFPISPCHFL